MVFGEMGIFCLPSKLSSDFHNFNQPWKNLAQFFQMDMTPWSNWRLLSDSPGPSFNVKRKRGPAGWVGTGKKKLRKIG